MSWLVELMMVVAATCSPSQVIVHPVVAASVGWGSQQFAILGAACIAAGGVAATIVTTSSRNRRDRMTDLYADALSGVAEYNEGLYRIRRRDGSADQRFDITTKLSDTKSSIDHSQALLRLRARPEVADSYDAYVRASQVEAGRQMQDAWTLPSVTSDENVNLYSACSREHSAPFRAYVIAVMQADLAYRWWSPRRRNAFRNAAERARQAAPSAGHPPDPPRATGPEGRLASQLGRPGSAAGRCRWRAGRESP